MFSLLSILIRTIDSVFSVVYTNRFLKSKREKTTSFFLWIVIYFLLQVLVFDVLHSRHPLNDVMSTIINVVLVWDLQWLLFHKGTSSQLFVCFSFVAGKMIVKYVVSVLNAAIGSIFARWIDAMVIQGKIVTGYQVDMINSVLICLTSLVSAILYALVLGIYLLLISKKYLRKEYQLQLRENVFLILPSIAAICISITLKMMIVTVENGTTSIIYSDVPETMFWIPLICIFLLGMVLANVILFQSVVQYQDENRKCVLLENQIRQMQKEVREIQDVYSDMRGLRHDLRGHINNIVQYVRKHHNIEDAELSGYIKNMEKTVSSLDFGYRSGSPIIDVIIHQKMQETERIGIELSVDFIYPKELAIDVYDIGVILNNALENAIEAAAMVETGRHISLHSYVKGNLFFIEVENSFVKDITMDEENGLPKSSKANAMYHGMGLVNIQRCARKYKGDIDILVDTSKQEQKTFNLTVMLNGKPAEL